MRARIALPQHRVASAVQHLPGPGFHDGRAKWNRHRSRETARRVANEISEDGFVPGPLRGVCSQPDSAHPLTIPYSCSEQRCLLLQGFQGLFRLGEFPTSSGVNFYAAYKQIALVPKQRMLRSVMRPISAALACFTLVIFIAGCHREATANGLTAVAFQTDWYPQPEHGGFYEALLKGYYRDQGLDVTILPGGPMNVAEQLVSTGTAQFAMGSSDHLLEADSQGEPLVAVGATMQTDPQGIMVHAGSPVRTFTDLDGRAIAVKTGSTWFEYIVRRYNLRNAREIPATYSIANFLADPNYIQQIFVTSEPFFARKAGAEVRTLLISQTGYSPYRVFFTSRSYLAQHPDVVAKFTRASIRGWRDYIQDPSLVNARLLRLNPALAPEQMQFTWQALREGHFVDGGDPADTGRMEPERWAAMYAQLSGLKLMAHPIDPATAYTLAYCNSP